MDRPSIYTLTYCIYLIYLIVIIVLNTTVLGLMFLNIFISILLYIRVKPDKDLIENNITRLYIPRNTDCSRCENEEK